MVAFLMILFLLVTVLLIFMVVITPSQSEGLASAFGGMGSDTFFGTKAGQHINRFTIFLAAAFLILAILISRIGPTGPEKRSILPPRQSSGTPGPAVPSR